LWAHARGPVRSWGVRRCGASLACLCARLSASRGSETPACEASPAALGATHGVVRMPAAARGRAAARGLTDESRLARRGASGAARAGPASVVPGAPPAVAHSAVRVRSAAAHGRWSLYGMRGAWVEGGQVRALRARSSLAAEGALPRASARRSALERHERALQKGEGWDSRDRALASFFQRAANINYDPPGLGWSSGPLQRAPPPVGQIGGRATPADPRAVRAWGVEAGPPPLAPRIERDVVPRMGALGSVRDPRGRG
jgi:hypothetical protein